MGYVEWYVPAIISYETIHYGYLKPDLKTNRKTMEDFLSKLSLSMDSKKPVRDGYWKRVRLNKIQEIYPYIKRSIKHGNKIDISKVKELPKNIDILTYSFPCQDLSQQGKQKGITKYTRSGLLWEIERILKLNRDRLPKYLLLENVMALVSNKFIGDFEEWIDALENLGYYSEPRIINAADYGSVQNRRRVFMISTLNDKNISWPKHKRNNKKLKDILEEKDDSNIEKYHSYETTEVTTTTSKVKKERLIDYSSFNSETYIYYPDGKGPTLTASGANSRLKIRIGNRIRYMNAREAYKYMGFRGSDYDKVKKNELITNNKAIFTCGNSISVEVLEAIFKEMFL